MPALMKRQCPRRNGLGLPDSNSVRVIHHLGLEHVGPSGHPTRTLTSPAGSFFFAVASSWRGSGNYRDFRRALRGSAGLLICMDTAGCGHAHGESVVLTDLAGSQRRSQLGLESRWSVVSMKGDDLDGTKGDLATPWLSKG